MKNYIKDLFFSLVSIDSPSGNEKKVAKFIQKEAKSFGLVMKEDQYGNLIGHIRGVGHPLMLCSHMDTVEPGRGIKPRIDKKGTIYSAGDTILGADDKAGITEILSTVRYLKENKVSHRPLDIVFTRQEEIGVVGAMHLDYSKVRAKEGLVVDLSGEPETIAIASPYITTVKIEIIGRSAHAGVNPENGINALQVAAHAIAQLKIGRIDEETTANIGVISGGVASNIVPDRVEVEGEVRSHVKKKSDEQMKLVKKAFRESAKKYGAKVSFSHDALCRGYKYSTSHNFVKKLIAHWNKNNVDPIIKKTGGGSDANVFKAHGITAIPVSYGGHDSHTTKESVNINDMEKVTRFLIDIATGN